MQDIVTIQQPQTITEEGEDDFHVWEEETGFQQQLTIKTPPDLYQPDLKCAYSREVRV